MFTKPKQRTIILLTLVGVFSLLIIIWNTQAQAWTLGDERAFEFLVRHVTHTHLHALVVAQTQAQTYALQFWSVQEAHCLLGLCSLVLGFTALFKKHWPLYAAGCFTACGLIALAWLELTRAVFFPLASMLCSLGFLLGSLVGSRHYAKAKEQANVRAIFSGRLSETSVRRLLVQPNVLQLEGEEREISLLYLQIQDHQPGVHQISAPTRIKLLREFCEEVTVISTKAGGCMLRNSGASLMVVFGAPLSAPNHAEQAVNTALQIQRRLLELGKQWERMEFPPQRCCFAIHTGAALLGAFNTSGRSEYVVLGESVALAARLCRVNDTYGTSLLVSATTFAKLPPHEYRTRWLESCGEIRIYEVYGDLATYRSPIDAAYYQNYEKAFAAYQAQDFEQARRHLEAALNILPHDRAAHLLRNKMS